MATAYESDGDYPLNISMSHPSATQTTLCTDDQNSTAKAITCMPAGMCV